MSLYFAVDLLKLKESAWRLANSSCKAMGSIFCSGPLPLPIGTVVGQGTDEVTKATEDGVTKAADEGVVTRATVVKCLAETIRSTKEQEVRSDHQLYFSWACKFYLVN